MFTNFAKITANSMSISTQYFRIDFQCGLHSYLYTKHSAIDAYTRMRTNTQNKCTHILYISVITLLTEYSVCAYIVYTDVLMLRTESYSTEFYISIFVLLNNFT